MSRGWSAAEAWREASPPRRPSLTPLVAQFQPARTILRTPRLPSPPLPQNRYLIILYYNATRHKQKVSLKDQEAELRRMQEKHGVDGEQHARPKK